MGAADVGFDRGFWRSVTSLDGADTKRVAKAIDQFQSNPDHPSLNLHPVRGDNTGRLHTIRASEEIRILLAKEGNLFVFLEAGHHDAIYDRAARARFVANPNTRFVGLIEPNDRYRLVDAGEVGLKDAPGVFDHWADVDLMEAGFDTAEISKIRACKVEDDLFGLEFSDEPFGLLIELMEQTPEQWRTPAIDQAAAVEERVRKAVVDFGALHGISRLFTAEEVAELAAAPIEDWMIFLHPDQQALVDRHFEGPARVRGSAGTGKTVVALHRAVALSKRFADQEEGTNRILFTTFIKSLPPVFEQLYHRLPGSKSDAVEFVNIDKLANRVCREAGDPVVTNPREINAAFATAFKRIVTSDSPLKAAGLTRAYLKSEVTAVIKGRGIRSIDEYLALERTGRRTRFTAPLRTQVWVLRDEWDHEMELRGTIDFCDVLIRARDHARQRIEPMFRAAIIDEAQDLTLVGLQLVRALVNGPDGFDRPDGLFIAGDGAQRIYPGGYSLRQAGVEVRGRTTVLHVNYRNTREIIASAMAVAGAESVDDLGEQYQRGDAPAEAGRDGVRPVLVSAGGGDDELVFIAHRARSLVDEGAMGFGDIAVCAPTNVQAKAMREKLVGAGIPCLDLQRYDGTASDEVKVGTFHRVKGLEFKVVFLPGLGADEFPRPIAAGQDAAQYDEDRALSISQLFVAMTRARDALFLLCSGDPSDVFADALDSFEVVET